MNGENVYNSSAIIRLKEKRILDLFVLGIKIVRRMRPRNFIRIFGLMEANAKSNGFHYNELDGRECICGLHEFTKFLLVIHVISRYDMDPN